MNPPWAFLRYWSISSSNSSSKVNRQGTTIFMVEQNANMALSIADRGYVLQTGSIVLTDTAQNLLCNEMMQKAYLGGAAVCETAGSGVSSNDLFCLKEPVGSL